MDEKTYTIADLMTRYGLTAQAVRQYLNNHMDDINADGIHAKKVKGDWQLDVIGLQKLDAMRGYNSNLALQAELRQEAEKHKLLEEISTLKTAMLTIKEQYQQNKEELYKQLLAEKDRAHKAELLQLESKSHLERQKEAAEAEKAALLAALQTEKDQRDALDKEKGETAQKIAEMEQERKKQAEEIFRLRVQLNDERKKSWWDKLFNK